MHDQLTEMDIKKMKEELNYRVVTLRHELLEEVKRTREFGDLSENAEYKCAKDAQRKNESRIRYLTGMINTADVVTTFEKGNRIGMLSMVKILFVEDEEEQDIQLVSTLRVDIDKGFVSVKSPLGQALLGHKPGDTVTVHVSDTVSYDVIVLEVGQGEDDDLPIRQF